MEMIKPKNLKMYRRKYYPDTHNSWLFQQEQPEYNLQAPALDINFAKFNLTKDDISLVECDTSRIRGRAAMRNHMQNVLRDNLDREKVLEYQKLTQSRLKKRYARDMEEAERQKRMPKSNLRAKKSKNKPGLPLRNKIKNKIISNRHANVMGKMEKERLRRELLKGRKHAEQLISLKNVPTVKIKPIILDLMKKKEENEIVKYSMKKGRRETIEAFFEMRRKEEGDLSTSFVDETEEALVQEEARKEVKRGKRKKVKKKLRFNV